MKNLKFYAKFANAVLRLSTAPRTKRISVRTVMCPTTPNRSSFFRIFDLPCFIPLSSLDPAPHTLGIGWSLSVSIAASYSAVCASSLDPIRNRKYTHSMIQCHWRSNAKTLKRNEHSSLSTMSLNRNEPRILRQTYGHLHSFHQLDYQTVWLNQTTQN